MRNGVNVQNLFLNINGFAVPAIKVGNRFYLRKGDFEIELLPHELPILQSMGYQIEPAQNNTNNLPQAPAKLLEELWEKLLQFYVFKF